jgi:L-ribulokinase
VKRHIVLGLDFGTESVRALLIDARTGEELAMAASAYEHGVIVDALPSGRRLPTEWALQDPGDWLAALESAARAALVEAGTPDVVGVGVDFTSSTVLPTTVDGTPLCRLPELADDPHAWPKLWNHHAAQPQADELTSLAAHLDPDRLALYGGRISSEWLVPKAMQILDESPGAFGATAHLVEGGDWITWQLTGALTRNACAAGFKALWQKREGYPSPRLLTAARPELAELFETTAGGDVRAPGDRVGRLSDEWSRRLGIAPGAAVAAAVIDAHAGFLGAGISDPRTLYLASGTSTCHLLVAPERHLVDGISGVVEDGIVAGRFAYEAGQASAGDMFDWFVRLSQRGHVELTSAAAALRPGESGLLALDWWNGCRTPLVDADLSGVILGLSVATSPAAIYRALLEATALGTRFVVDTFAKGGIEIEQLVVGGGLTANELLLQIYADATGRPVAAVASSQPSARGAAVLAAAAAGEYDTVGAAVAALAPAPARVIEPDLEAYAVYDELYALYRDLVPIYGSLDSPLKRLSALRRAAAAELAAVAP